MKKTIKEIVPGIYIIENYISAHTADFLIKNISPYLIETPRNQIYGGPGGTVLINPDSVSEYKDVEGYNIAIDIYNGLVFSINNLISEVFKSEHQVKSYFFSCMRPDSFNDLHMDNFYEDDDGLIHSRKQYVSNKSGLLYLNNDYSGGELFFPKQSISLKPEVGSLVFFEGDHLKPHGVNKIISGDRYNLVTFYEPKGESIKNEKLF